MRKIKPLRIHVVSSTHWDREWYWSFEEFRIRLVDLLDELINIFTTNPSYQHFMLDGQVAPVLDYLEIRPEKTKEIKNLIEKDKLSIGPWFVLADEFLPSEETHIRNMFIGIREASKFGKYMKVGYNPDQFGHISQMPQILNNFGIKTAFISRGYELKKRGRVFKWQAPDGSFVVTLFQDYRGIPPSTVRSNKILDQIENYLQKNLIPHNISPIWLMLNGGDHEMPTSVIPEVLRQASRKFKILFEHSSLERFFKELLLNIRQLRVKKGELRENNRAGKVYLYNVLSSRVYLKQASFNSSIYLEYLAEPLCALAHFEGKMNYPHQLLEKAWRYHLLNMAHDSICGCSPDSVHRDMMRRFHWVGEISGMLFQRAIYQLTRKSDEDDLLVNIRPPCQNLLFNTQRQEDIIPFAVVNSLGNRRSEIVEVRINNVLSSQKGEWHVKDAEGKEVPSQQVSPVYIKAKELDFGDRPSQVEWNRRVVGLEYKPQVFYIKANEIPGVGFRKYTIVKGKANSPLKEECIASETSLENEKIRVSINKNGTLNIQDKDTRQLYSNLNIFEDGGDCTPLSGGYHYQAPLHDVIYTSEKLNAKTRSLASGPLVAALEVRISLPIPEKGDTIKEIRSKKLVPLNIRTIVSLKSGIPWVEIEVIIENSATDHRLRVVFPTGINSDTLRAQGHFDVMRRAITKKPWPTESMREFIYLEDKNKGFALFTTGLHEYEAKENGRIALTLFRSNTYVTQLWWPGVQSIDARILGKSRYRYGIMPTRPGISDASLIEYARKFNRPLTAVRCFWGPPYLRKLVESCQKEFIITAVKKHWQRDTLIIRFFNANSRRTTGIIRFGKNINEAYKTDMKEERQERLKVTYKNCVQVKARPKEIFTMEVLFSKEEKVLSKSTG